MPLRTQIILFGFVTSMIGLAVGGYGFFTQHDAMMSVGYMDLQVLGMAQLCAGAVLRDA